MSNKFKINNFIDLAITIGKYLMLDYLISVIFLQIIASLDAYKGIIIRM